MIVCDLEIRHEQNSCLLEIDYLQSPTCQLFLAINQASLPCRGLGSSSRQNTLWGASPSGDAGSERSADQGNLYLTSMYSEAGAAVAEIITARRIKSILLIKDVDKHTPHPPIWSKMFHSFTFRPPLKVHNWHIYFPHALQFSVSSVSPQSSQSILFPDLVCYKPVWTVEQLFDHNWFWTSLNYLNIGPLWSNSVVVDELNTSLRRQRFMNYRFMFR